MCSLLDHVHERRLPLPEDSGRGRGHGPRARARAPKTQLVRAARGTEGPRRACAPVRVRRWIGSRAHASTSRAKAVPFIYTGFSSLSGLCSGTAPFAPTVRYMYLLEDYLLISHASHMNARWLSR